MAQPADSVARTLNRLTDRAFVDGLTGNDRAAMEEFIQDYFCDENDLGKHYTKLILQVYLAT